MKFHFNPPLPDCALAVCDNSQPPVSKLRPEEASLLPENAAEKRKSEFALGRAAARQALAELGLREPPPVLRGAGREPLWPEGIVGSITHCGSFAIAVVGKQEHVKALGIDLEDVERVSHDEIARFICNEREHRWVFDGDDGQLRLAMLFSAKESIYKALYPLEQRFFDFHAVTLTWLPERQQFVGTLSPQFRERYPIEVGCQREGHFVFTHAFLASRANA